MVTDGIITTVLLFLDAESLISYGGLLFVCLIVYGSTGLFFCFFLPSGAILFAAGVLTASGNLPHTMFTVCAVLILSSFAGSITGYGFGWKAGQLLRERSDSKFFRRKHLDAAEEFYRKYGNLAVTAGYYLPIIRSFTAVVAGMVKLNFSRFALLAFAGSVMWVAGFAFAGYFIGSRPFLKPWLKYIVLGFILLITIPLLIRVIREIRNKQKEIK